MFVVNQVSFVGCWITLLFAFISGLLRDARLPITSKYPAHIGSKDIVDVLILWSVWGTVPAGRISVVSVLNIGRNDARVSA